MTPDPKLVEAVARAIADKQTYGVPWEQLLASSQLQYIGQAQAVLAAISASGEWWVAPWEILETDPIATALYNCGVEATDLLGTWRDVRDAHLKDTGTDK
jgi:hypothetical protein